MDTKCKRAIKIIAELSITCSDRLGDILAPIFFENDKCALFLCRENRSVEILVPTNDEKKQFEVFWLLTELISLLRELENKHLIYVICQAEDHFSEFYYQGKNDYRTTQINSVIKISNSDTLHEEKNGLHSVYKNDNLILSGVIGPFAIYDDLIHFLNSIVYPTSGLKKYIKRGFKSEESYLSTRANRISKISIFVAVFIALVSPFISVWWSNKYGVSRIDETQYQRFIKSIENCRDSVSSVYNKSISN